MSDRVSRAITVAVALTLLGVSGCEGEESCGDGVRSAAEACDDGNRQSGDGCSASRELDDDSRTPGDDRPCDGPEDCGSGAFCQTASHDRTCRVGGILTLCHPDRDCEDVSE
jgi:cysteine-rich repeat protein